MRKRFLRTAAMANFRTAFFSSSGLKRGSEWLWIGSLFAGLSITLFLFGEGDATECASRRRRSRCGSDFQKGDTVAEDEGSGERGRAMYCWCEGKEEEFQHFPSRSSLAVPLPGATFLFSGRVSLA